MKLTLKLLLALSLAALVAVPSALAGQRAGAFTLSPLIGYHTFEGDQRTDDDLTYGLGFGYNITANWAVELDVRHTPTETTSRARGGVQDLDVVTTSLNALYHFNPEGSFVPYLSAGLGGMYFRNGGNDDDDLDAMLSAGAGIKYFVSEDLALRLDARYLADLHSDRPHERGSQSSNTDHNLMTTVGLVWQFGGPRLAPAPLDSDLDGIPDSRDKCPGTPLGVAVDAVGCPPAPPAPEPPKPVVAPAPPPAPKPAPAPAPKPIVREVITFNLLFDFDKADIKDEMLPALEQAKKILNEDNNVAFVVGGHTCSIGTDAYNQKLSERRAAAVKNWLVGNGIAADRLETVGYGETQPRYDNKTDEGRRMNRRVELQTK